MQEKDIPDIRDAFFDKLYELAKIDKNIIFLTADMGALSLYKFKKDLKDQYINVGISEQNMVGLAAGLALEGKNVFIYAIASFVTMRCYEQIKIDISYMNLPVKIIGSGPGIVYGCDGDTHHTIQDIAIMRALPGMVIYNPSDSETMFGLADIVYKSKSPVYIRMDKGKYSYPDKDFSLGYRIRKIGSRNLNSILIITTGTIVHQALKIKLENLEPGILEIYRLKPIDDKILEIINPYDIIITLEEHSLIGGLGSIISEIMVDNNIIKPIKRIGIPDEYCKKHGDRDWMYSYYKLDLDSIEKEINNFVNKLS